MIQNHRAVFAGGNTDRCCGIETPTLRFLQRQSVRSQTSCVSPGSGLCGMALIPVNVTARILGKGKTGAAAGAETGRGGSGRIMAKAHSYVCMGRQTTTYCAAHLQLFVFYMSRPFTVDKFNL